MAAIAQDYRQPEPFEVPEGGLASFLTATTGEWAEATNDDYIPETGIAGVKQVADKLAEYGRYEDEYMVHAAEGETVIPAQVLDLNPRLKAKLYREMREMGLEPERYVVGNELNSLNPVTGQPEFFLKKIFKGIKKAVKKVVKVFKKVAPVVLPFVLNAVFPGMGTVLSGALGSGLGTAIQGGNLKDVLKSAAIGGAAGFIGGKITGAETGIGDDPFKFQNPFGGAEQAATGATSDVVAQNVGATPTTPPSGALPPASDLSPVAQNLNMTPSGGLTPLEAQVAQGLSPTAPSPAVGTDFVGQAANAGAVSTPVGGDISSSLLQPEQVSGLTAAGQPLPQGVDPSTLNVSNTTTAGDVLSGTATPEVTQSYLQAVDSGRNIFERAGDYLFRGGRSPAEIAMEASRAGMDAAQLARQEALSMGLTEAETSKYVLDVVKEAKAGVQPGMFQKYLPSTALALAGLGAAGGFETPELEPLYDPYGGATGMSLLEQNRAMYAPGVFRYAAGGGDVSFPRMNGAIYGPGTETSDDIPAMLSDGEFVMTARAVRGAGDGDRERGMQRMYDIMRRFEGGAVSGN